MLCIPLISKRLSVFNLLLLLLLQGIAKAREVGFLDASCGNWRFDLAEYEHYEQVCPTAPKPQQSSKHVPSAGPMRASGSYCILGTWSFVASF